MATILEEWQEGRISDMEALRALAIHLGEVESEIAPLEAEKAALRETIGLILDRVGEPVQIAGFGRMELSAPAIVQSFDKKQLDALIEDLENENPDLAARIAACRTKSMRAGGVRITREKSSK